MSSALFAALAVVAFAATGAYGRCPANIEAVTATVTQVFRFSRTPYDMTFSPTRPSMLTPKGASSCGPAYIAQFSEGKCDAKCSQQEAAPVSTINGCQYSFSDGSSWVFNLKLTCDASAVALTLENEAGVTQNESRYIYDFIGRYIDVCEKPTAPTEPATTVVPTAAPPADFTETMKLLVIISVALGIVGVVLGAIALVILMCKRGRPQGDACVMGYAVIADGHLKTPLIVKQV